MTPDQAKKLLRGVTEQTLSPGPVPHPRRVEITTIDGTASDVGYALQLLTKEGLTGDELKFWDEAFLRSLDFASDFVPANTLESPSKEAAAFADHAVRERRQRLLGGIGS